jgi:hypothetical protein
MATDAHKKAYASLNSGTYRSFDRLCKKGLDEPAKHRPTSLHLIQALMDVEGMKESKLPKS